MKKIVIISEDNFKRMVKKVLKEQNFPLDDITPASDNTMYKMPPSKTGFQRQYATGNEEKIDAAWEKSKHFDRFGRDRAEAQMWAIGLSFIPFVGWIGAAGIYVTEAITLYQHGQKKEAGINLIFGVLSAGIGYFKTLQYFSSLGEKGAVELGKKVASGGGTFTKVEKAALDEILSNPQEVGTVINTVLKSKGVTATAKAKGVVVPDFVKNTVKEFAPYVAAKVGYEGGWQIGNKLFAPKPGNQKP
jgi:hypothetical protein